MVRNEELERTILADPENPEAYQVYADWLQSQGDPRGELAAIQVALAAGERKELRNRERALLAEHRQALLGALPDPGKSGDAWAALQLGWRAGWLRSARVSASDDHPLPALYRTLLACESARFLTDLTIGLGNNDGENHYEPLNEVVEEVGTPPALRTLYLADFEQEQSEISWSHLGDVGIWLRRARGLRDLTLRGGTMALGRIDMPELRRFSVITGGFTAENVRDVARAHWPKLERLHLYFGQENYGATAGVDDLRPILEGRGLPALRELGLANSEFADQLATVLGKSPVLEQVKVLDLSLGTLSDDGAEALLASAPAFGHLDRLDLSGNFLSGEAVDRVSSLCRDVRTDEQREGDEDDGRVYRYPSVGE